MKGGKGGRGEEIVLTLPFVFSAYATADPNPKTVQ